MLVTKMKLMIYLPKCYVSFLITIKLVLITFFYRSDIRTPYTKNKISRRKLSK